MAKQWPQDDQPVDFSDLADSIQAAILFAYTIKRKNVDKSIPWTGYDIGSDEKVTCFGPDEQLSAKSLAYSLDDQGRTAFEEIIGLAIRLGIEQGRRVFKTSTCYTLEQLRLKFLDETQENRCK